MTKTTSDTPETSPTKGPKLDATQEFILMKRMLPLALTGVNVTQMAKQLGASRFIVSRLANKIEFEKMLEEATDSEVLPVIAKARRELSRLVDKAIKVLEHHLDAKNLDAAKTVFKTVGIENHEPEKRDAPINIIMPGQSSPEQTVETTFTIQGDES